MTIENLEEEIAILKNQLNLDHDKLLQLENELRMLKQGMPQQVASPVMPQQMAPQPRPQMMPQQMAPQPRPQMMPQQMVPQPQPPVMPKMTPQARKEFDWEKFIGKSWMGIMASVLIFISIIMFAVVILPALPDEVKMVIMFAVSIAFVVVGLILYKKANTVFYMILSACGMGALYISLLLSNIYFNRIGDIPLYLLILIWAVGIAIVAKNNVATFSIVGNAGILISIVLGTAKCAAYDDVVKFIVLVLFFVISAVIFGWLNNKFMLSNSICNLIGLILLTIGYAEIAAHNVVLLAILCIATLGHLIYISIRKIEPYFVFNIVHKWIIYFMWSAFIFSQTYLARISIKLEDYLSVFSIYAMSIVSILLVNLYYGNKERSDKFYSRQIIEIVDIVTISIVVLALNVYGYIFVLVVPLVFMIIGLIKKDNKYIYATLATLTAGLVINEICFTGVLILACSAVLVIAYQRQISVKSDVIRAITSVIIRIAFLQTLYNLFDICDWNYKYYGIILVTFIFAIDLLFKYLLSHNMKDKAVLYVTYASSVITAIAVSGLLMDANDVLYYITLLIGCAIFMNNVVRFIRSKEIWKQLYGMIKISLYIILVFSTLEKATILLSIVLFIAAIIWILIGFRLRAKAVRLYGLVTALISIFKLIVVDISYNSFLTRAAGFFVCGILAFLISFIYNKFEKNNNINGER